MQFRGTVRDAKCSSRGINIHILGGDDCSTDELRAYFDEAVMISIEIIAPEATYETEAFELDSE